MGCSLIDAAFYALFEGAIKICLFLNAHGHHGFFYGLSHMGRSEALLKTSPNIFERFLAPGNPKRECGRMLVLHIRDASECTLRSKGVRAAKDSFR